MSDYRKVYGSDWEFVENDGICVYCGDKATTKDHFIPVSAEYMISDLKSTYKCKVLLPACSNCNNIAGNRVFNTFSQKQKYIQGRIRDKNRDLLRAGLWTKEELGELGPSLQKYIESSLRELISIERRINWRIIDNPAYAKIVRLNSRQESTGKFFAPKNVDKGGIIEKEKN
jgi:hypothetical protein